MNRTQQQMVYIPKSEMFAMQVSLAALIMQMRLEARKGTFSAPVAEEMEQHTNALMDFLNKYQC